MHNRPVVGTRFAFDGLPPAVRAMVTIDERTPPLLTNWREPSIDHDRLRSLFGADRLRAHVAELVRLL